MKAVVVYESLWGNTAAIAQSIAVGLGEDAVALSTRDATPEAIEGADLIVAGAPVFGFRLPTESMRENIGRNHKYDANPPDLTKPSMEWWLSQLGPGDAHFATFDTRIRWSLGGSGKTIAKMLSAKGYRQICEPEKFIVEGETGPLKVGESQRAQEWGVELAHAVWGRIPVEV